MEYELYGKVNAFTKSYKRLTDSSIDMTTPVTDIGYYVINLRQPFHGVFYLINVLPQCVPNKSELKTLPSEGSAYLAFVSAEDYFFSVEPAIETGLLYGDLPLVPFDIVKQTFEQVIDDGYIRSIYSVRLRYAAFHDRSNLDNSYILLPVWELRGQIVDRPQYETPQMEPYTAEYYQQYMGQCAYVNAQTGEYIAPYDSSAERDYATIVYAE